MSDTVINKDNLRIVPFSLLYEGMVVEEDIYDSTASIMIAKGGITLDANRIETIKKHNDYSSFINVTGNTYKALTQREHDYPVESRTEMEEASGYTEVKDDTFQILGEIANTKNVPQEALYSVSENLSNRLETVPQSSVLALINALAPVDEYLQRHCVNVSLLNGLMGKWMNMPKDEVDTLVLIGLLHDCGKAMIPTQILNAPRKLTVTEFEVIKNHPKFGYDLLTEFPEHVRLGARYHHEKISGLGYPNRIGGDNLPLEARITAVSDIYDAMVSRRSYKKPNSPFSIMAMLSKLQGTDLDKELVDIFISNMPHDLVDKTVMMSDGRLGVIRSFDVKDIEYPMIEVNGRVIKSNEDLYCVSMHNDD
ncbi:MAG: HD-GYP domain-containing protein [Oscillospiraceae bacterium]|nr:HD-GYP domain-containing protein [Oscillospiraceae bacterium]